MAGPLLTRGPVFRFVKCFGKNFLKNIFKKCIDFFPEIAYNEYNKREEIITMTTLETAIKFFNNEYEEVKRDLERADLLEHRAFYTNNAVQRCLGVAFFVQNLGVSFEEINPHYDEIRTKINKLLLDK